jgi:hypothetical protein
MASEESSDATSAKESGIVEGPTQVMETPVLDELIAESVRPDSLPDVSAAPRPEPPARWVLVAAAVRRVTRSLPRRVGPLLLFAVLVGVGLGIVVTVAATSILR